MEQMETCFNEVLCGSESMILAYEYLPVVTLGRRLKKDDFVSSPFFDVVETQRGGEATYHNPGQLVIYPILKLRDWNLGVRNYVCLLEKVSIELLESHGLNLKRIESAPGLYTDEGKILSIGLRVKSGVSTHGISININNDLQEFKKLTLCGTQSPAVDRLANYKSLGTQEVYSQWIEIFKKHLDNL